MNAYTLVEVCPKCGSTWISTKYVGGVKGDDYLARRCGGCGYHWTTPPLDRQEDHP